MNRRVCRGLAQAQDKPAERNLAIPKARMRSLPKTFAIFLSGLKNCLFSGSWRLFFLMYAQSCLMHSARLASFFANNVGEVSAELHGFGESGSFGHFGCFLVDVG